MQRHQFIDTRRDVTIGIASEVFVSSSRSKKLITTPQILDKQRKSFDSVDVS